MDLAEPQRPGSKPGPLAWIVWFISDFSLPINEESFEASSQLAPRRACLADWMLLENMEDDSNKNAPT